MKVTGIGRTIQCKNCLQRGHNKASCKNPKVTPEPKPKKKMGRPRLDPDISHWTRGGVRGGVRGSRGGAMGSRGGRGGNRGGVVGNIGGVVANRGGRGKLKVVEVLKLKVIQLKFEDDTILEKYLVHLWKSMQDLKQSGYSIEEIKNSLSLTDSRMKQLNDYNDTIEQVLPMSMEEEYPPQTETQDGGEEIIPETQPESEEEEGINDTQELPVHLRIVKRRRPSQRIVKNKLKKMGCVGTSASSALELD
ncbi:unnamed protein product [Lactuca saligna]|uniref:CCHC-type domain-containing protein n=1 Tax=Lactuca saligna TaxID=75948 RepID=A0AA35VSF4_LACSI|nr:unnamed protein product [Lactuca saligna]